MGIGIWELRVLTSPIKRMMAFAALCSLVLVGCGRDGERAADPYSTEYCEGLGRAAIFFTCCIPEGVGDCPSNGDGFMDYCALVTVTRREPSSLRLTATVQGRQQTSQSCTISPLVSGSM